MEKSSLEPLYDPEAVRPMWEELAQCGVVKALRDFLPVDEKLNLATLRDHTALREGP